MNTKLLLFALLALMCGTAFAQFRKGVHAGIGSSWVSSQVKQDKHTSYVLGAVAEYRLKSGFVFHGELNYARKGSTLYNPERSIINGMIDEYEFYLDYIDLPLSVGYSFFGRGKHIVLTPRVGGYFAFGVGGYGLLTTPNISHGGGSSTIRVSPFELTMGQMPDREGFYVFDDFTRPELGIVMGVDFEFSKHFRLSMNAQIGELFQLTYYYQAGWLHCRTWHVTFGYMF